ncbi:hypothetical protein TNCT_670601, partial [Trichonephila clavata]
ITDGETIYNSMALLCSEYDFQGANGTTNWPPDSIALNYRRSTPQKEVKLNIYLNEML